MRCGFQAVRGSRRPLAVVSQPAEGAFPFCADGRARAKFDWRPRTNYFDVISHKKMGPGGNSEVVQRTSGITELISVKTRVCAKFSGPHNAEAICHALKTLEKGLLLDPRHCLTSAKNRIFIILKGFKVNPCNF